MTFAYTTDTSASIVTKNVGGVIGTTSSFMIAQNGSVRIAFAESTRVRVVTMTNAAFQISSAVTLIRIADVSLPEENHDHDHRK